jgi:pyrroloquinoline quinone biosynthesis protein B
MIVRVLGSAAGGGFPQANCNCSNCRSVRSGAPGFQSRTQTSVAVSSDGEAWMLLGASPDVRQQIAQTASLHPSGDCLRSSPIKVVALTCTEVDGIAGLLSLREGFDFDLLASTSTLGMLARNSIFNVLSPVCVRRVPLDCGQAQTRIGLEVEAFMVAGKTTRTGAQGDTIGLCVRELSSGASFFYIPSCASIDAALARRLETASLLLFDGTLYTDDELVAQGLAQKTGQDMGHISMSGPRGAIAALAELSIKRRVFIHINNSNPVLNENSPERMAVKQAGWEVAFDGMELRL